MSGHIRVAGIKNGVAVDHLNPFTALKIIELLQLTEHDETVSVGLNLESSKLHRKDVLKIEGHNFSEEELQKIALFSPQATISIIKDSKVTKKIPVTLPKLFSKTFICPNTKCITNHEYLDTLFTIQSEKPISLKCSYCERLFSLSGMKFKIVAPKASISE